MCNACATAGIFCLRLGDFPPHTQKKLVNKNPPAMTDGLSREAPSRGTLLDIQLKTLQSLSLLVEWWRGRQQQRGGECTFQRFLQTLASEEGFRSLGQRFESFLARCRTLEDVVFYYVALFKAFDSPHVGDVEDVLRSLRRNYPARVLRSAHRLLAEQQPALLGGARLGRATFFDGGQLEKLFFYAVEKVLNRGVEAVEFRSRLRRDCLRRWLSHSVLEDCRDNNNNAPEERESASEDSSDPEEEELEEVEECEQLEEFEEFEEDDAPGESDHSGHHRTEEHRRPKEDVRTTGKLGKQPREGQDGRESRKRRPTKDRADRGERDDDVDASRHHGNDDGRSEARHSYRPAADLGDVLVALAPDLRSPTTSPPEESGQQPATVAQHSTLANAVALFD